MFFVGLVIGFGIYLLILLFANKGLGVGWCFLILAAVGVVVFSAIDWKSGLGYVFCVVALFIIGYVVGEKKEMEEHKSSSIITKQYSRYLNHCWYCGSQIDSYHEALCPRCGKHYICSKCGRCYCDNPASKQNYSSSSLAQLSNDNVSSIPTYPIEKKQFLDVKMEKTINTDDIFFQLNYFVDYTYDYILQLRNSYYIGSRKMHYEMVKQLDSIEQLINELKLNDNSSLNEYDEYWKKVSSYIKCPSNETNETVEYYTLHDLYYSKIVDLYYDIKSKAKNYSIWLH